MDVLLFPDGRDNFRQKLRVFHRGISTILNIFCIERVHRCLTLTRVLDQLNERIFLVVLRVDLAVHGGETLRSGDHGVFVDRHVCIALPPGLCTGNLRFQLLTNGVEAVHICRGEVVLDLNGLAGVDELLQPDLICLAEVPILALLQQRFDLRVQRIQRFDVSGQLIRNRAIARILRVCTHLRKLRAGGFRQCLEGVRPFRDDLIRFLLTVRPHFDKAVYPVLSVCGGAHEVALAHAESIESVGIPVEGFGSGVFPVFRCLVHRLESFSRLTGTGSKIRDGDCRGNGGNSQSHPDCRAAGQHRHKAFEATTGSGDRCTELAECGGDRANAAGDL